MAENPDFKELLQLLNAASADYLLVGGYAVMEYSEPRYTKDLDIWVRNSVDNSAKVYRALLEFGAPLEADTVTQETFSEDEVVYQIGIVPNRIDILTTLSGLKFENAWPNRRLSEMFGVPVNFISLGDLIANKEATGRREDTLHLKELRKKIL